MNGKSGTGPEPHEPFATRHVAEVPPQPPQQQWLIEDLWLAQGVGILGGNPKVGLCRARHKKLHAASRIMPRAPPFDRTAAQITLADAA